MKNETRLQATHLYLDMLAQHQRTGRAFSIRDINQLLGFSSTATPRYYLKILTRWGLITHVPKGARTILPIALENYPPVEYRKEE